MLRVVNPELRMKVIAVLAVISLPIIVLGYMMYRSSHGGSQMLVERTKSLRVHGTVANIIQVHGYLLKIQTDTGLVSEPYAVDELVRDVAIGDSILKDSGSPHCILVRDGHVIGTYWYSYALRRRDFPDSNFHD